LSLLGKNRGQLDAYECEGGDALATAGGTPALLARHRRYLVLGPVLDGAAVSEDG